MNLDLILTGDYDKAHAAKFIQKKTTGRVKTPTVEERFTLG